MANRIIVFELVDVEWDVVGEFATRHPRSALARVLASSAVLLGSDADDLPSWTTWPALHRGIAMGPAAATGYDTGATSLDHPPVWERLRAAGVSVGLVGVPQTRVPAADTAGYDFVVPDPLLDDDRAHPAWLGTFARYHRGVVRAPLGEGRRGSAAGAGRVLAQSPSLGIGPRTYAALLGHRVRGIVDGSGGDRRQVHQSLMSFDLFDRLQRAHRPELAIYATAPLASTVHRHRPGARPHEIAEAETDAQWLTAHRAEAEWAVRAANAMLLRLLDRADRGADASEGSRDRPDSRDRSDGIEVWFVSAVTPRAATPERLHTQVVLTDPVRFLQAMGLPDDGWRARSEPADRFTFQVEPSYVDAFQRSVAAVAIDGRPLRSRHRSRGLFSVEFGQRDVHGRTDAVTVADAARPLSALGLTCVRVEDPVAGGERRGWLGRYDARYDASRPSAATSGPARVQVAAVADALLAAFAKGGQRRATIAGR